MGDCEAEALGTVIHIRPGHGGDDKHENSWTFAEKLQRRRHQSYESNAIFRTDMMLLK